MKDYKYEEKIIKEIIPQAEDFPLINNYGWEWETKGKTYNVRHELNCYGCDCDHWLFLDLSKVGTKGCMKTFDTFEETIDFLKETDWKN